MINRIIPALRYLFKNELPRKNEILTEIRQALTDSFIEIRLGEKLEKTVKVNGEGKITSKGFGEEKPWMMNGIIGPLVGLKQLIDGTETSFKD